LSSDHGKEVGGINLDMRSSSLKGFGRISATSSNIALSEMTEGKL